MLSSFWLGVLIVVTIGILLLQVSVCFWLLFVAFPKFIEEQPKPVDPVAIKFANVVTNWFLFAVPVLMFVSGFFIATSIPS